MRRAVVLLALVALAPAAGAEPGRAWHFTADNDYFNFWQCPDCRPDFGYTHGAELSLHTSGIPSLLEHVAWMVAPDSTRMHERFVVGLRQEIYTPWREAGDQPFAGWLELNVGIQHESGGSLRAARLRVGVTGTPSLADRTQNWFHHAFGFPNGRDWSHQIPFEPGVAIEVERARLFRVGGTALRAEVGPRARARLGTFVADLTAGGDLTLGFHPAPPWRLSDRPAAGRAALYLIAAARADAIARNEFLDGALFRQSPSIEKRRLVPEAEIGVGLRLDRVRLEWRATRRGKEFDSQPTPHSFSTVAISLLPAAR